MERRLASDRMTDYDKQLVKAQSAYQEEKWEDVVNSLEHLLQEGSDATDKIRITAYLLGSSALRNLKKIDQSINALKKGLEEYPMQAGMLHNLGNCYRDQGGNARWKAHECFDKALEIEPNSEKLVLALTRNLLDLSFPGLAYQRLRKWISDQPTHNSLGADTLSLLFELVARVLEPPLAQSIGNWCLNQLGQLSKNNLNGQAGIAIFQGRLGQSEEALESFNNAKASLAQLHEQSIIENQNSKNLRKQEQTIINAGWNLGCHLLKHGYMGEGWKLYDYGLQTPAPGLQRWQRALPKPFNEHAVPIWDGSDLAGRRLLVMGEQAIGDSMMFLRLLPELLKETSNITLMLPSRLVPIYQRSYPDLTVISDDIVENELDPSLFDLQIPCGSVPSLRMKSWLKNGWEQSPLIPNSDDLKRLKNKYREGLNPEQVLIGISWLGGGKTERIRTKSMPSDNFQAVLKQIPKARFVSVQYGNCKKQVEAWQHDGIDVIFDDDIDAIKDMDSWLTQVACCDMIVSVANTTIHGAGGLGKPTLCLQSRSTDWRWIDGLKHSYWYESVDAISQAKDGSWDETINQVQNWVSTISNKDNYQQPSKAERQQNCLDAMTFTTHHVNNQ